MTLYTKYKGGLVRKCPYWRTSQYLSRRVSNGDFWGVHPEALAAEIKRLEDKINLLSQQQRRQI